MTFSVYTFKVNSYVVGHLSDTMETLWNCSCSTKIYRKLSHFQTKWLKKKHRTIHHVYRASLDMRSESARFRISNRLPAILNEVSQGFSTSLQKNSGILSRFGHNRFLPNPFLCVEQKMKIFFCLISTPWIRVMDVERIMVLSSSNFAATGDDW
jgi:hypothetical protein